MTVSLIGNRGKRLAYDRLRVRQRTAKFARAMEAACTCQFKPSYPPPSYAFRSRLGELKPGEVEELKRQDPVRDQLGLEIADIHCTAVKKKARRTSNEKTLANPESQPRSPRSAKRTRRQDPTQKTIPRQAQARYGKSKPARTAFDAPAPAQIRPPAA